MLNARRAAIKMHGRIPAILWTDHANIARFGSLPLERIEPKHFRWNAELSSGAQSFHGNFPHPESWRSTLFRGGKMSCRKASVPPTFAMEFPCFCCLYLRPLLFVCFCSCVVMLRLLYFVVCLLDGCLFCNMF